MKQSCSFALVHGLEDDSFCGFEHDDHFISVGLLATCVVTRVQRIQDVQHRFMLFLIFIQTVLVDFLLAVVVDQVNQYRGHKHLSLECC